MYIISMMIHNCPINWHSDGVNITRVVRVADALNEESVIDDDAFANLLYSIPMDKMTQSEINVCDRYRAKCSDVYCVALSAVVLTRLSRYTFHHRNPKKMVDGTACLLRIFAGGIDVSSREAEFIVAYIHNELHDGPRVALPRLEHKTT